MPGESHPWEARRATRFAAPSRSSPPRDSPMSGKSKDAVAPTEGGLGGASAVESPNNPLNGRPFSRKYYDIREQRRKLPVWQYLTQLEKLMNEHQVIIVEGETGSGESQRGEVGRVRRAGRGSGGARALALSSSSPPAVSRRCIAYAPVTLPITHLPHPLQSPSLTSSPRLPFLQVRPLRSRKTSSTRASTRSLALQSRA